MAKPGWADILELLLTGIFEILAKTLHDRSRETEWSNSPVDH